MRFHSTYLNPSNHSLPLPKIKPRPKRTRHNNPEYQNDVIEALKQDRFKSVIDSVFN